MFFGVSSAHSLHRAKYRYGPNIDTIVGHLVLGVSCSLHDMGKRPGICGHFRSSDDPIIFVRFGVLSAHTARHAKNRCVPNIDTVVGDLVALRFCILLYGIGKRPGMCGDNFGCPCDPIIFRCFGPQQSIVSKYRSVPNIGTLVVTSSATCYFPSTHVPKAIS